MQTAELNHLDSTFMNMDRRPDTWSVQVEVRVTGRIEEDRLRAAIRHATQRHPIARARVQPHGHGVRRHFWDIPDQIDHLPLTVFEADGDAEVAAARSRLQSIQVPVSMSPAFLVYLVHHRDGDWLMLNVSHAMGDGVSALRIIQSIVRHYDGEPDPVPDLDPLKVRDLKHVVGSKSLAQRRGRVKLLAKHLGKARSAPTRVTGIGVSVKDPDSLPGYGFELLPFSPEETREFMARRVKPATVNDMLIAGLVLTIKEWNARHGGKAGRTSIMMPVNMRPEAWWYEVVSNFSSYVSVSLLAQEQTNFEATTQVVCQQTTAYKEAGAAGKITDLYFSPQAPLPAGVSVGAATMGDRMFLTVRYRLSQFDAAAAKDFRDLYRSVLLG